MKDEIILYLFALKLEELREIKTHMERLIEMRIEAEKETLIGK